MYKYVTGNDGPKGRAGDRQDHIYMGAKDISTLANGRNPLSINLLLLFTAYTLFGYQFRRPADWFDNFKTYSVLFLERQICLHHEPNFTKMCKLSEQFKNLVKNNQKLIAVPQR